jgi:hypothetical protein
MSLWCLDHLFSHWIDMIMPHLHYSENGVITSCNPTIKHTENKLVSAVNDPKRGVMSPSSTPRAARDQLVVCI